MKMRIRDEGGCGEMVGCVKKSWLKRGLGPDEEQLACIHLCQSAKCGRIHDLVHAGDLARRDITNCHLYLERDFRRIRRQVEAHNPAASIYRRRFGIETRASFVSPSERGTR